MILVNVAFTLWNATVVNMSRIVNGNAQVVRMMADSDLSGNISATEASTLADTINDTLSSPDSFEDMLVYLNIPLGFSIDEVSFNTESSTVEFSGLAV